MYYIEFFLTRKCNQTCYYCSIFRDNKQTEIDTDKLKFVLDNSPSKTAVEMTGGEIGLISNIDEVFKTIYNHNRVKRIIALSNGLIRKNGSDWLDKVEYWEHLIKDIKGKELIKFYDLDFSSKVKNIIITTEITTKSILSNWDYFKKMGITSDKFMIKLMNDKTHNIEKFIPEVRKLFTLLGKDREVKMVDSFGDVKYNASRLICGLNPPYAFIDFEDNVIGHCAVKFKDCKRVKFNAENYNKLFYGSLFKEFEYCKSCYSFDDGKDKAKHIIKSKKGNFQNRSFRY